MKNKIIFFKNILKKNFVVGICVSYFAIIANIIPTLIEVNLEYLWGCLIGISFIIIWVMLELVFNINKFFLIFFQTVFFIIPFLIVIIFMENKTFNNFSMISTIWFFNIIAGINLRFEYFLQKKKLVEAKK